MSEIKVATVVRLYAGDQLVAELDSAELFSVVLTRIVAHGPAQLSAPITDKDQTP